jgi:endonuclease-3
LRRRPPAPERGRIALILERLRDDYPDAECELDFQSPFQLLVATILSAQCTDKRVNMVTPALFDRFPDSGAMAAAPVEEIQELVKTTGFFRNKAKNIKGASERIVAEHGGEVPRTMPELLRLPGVARKTANCVLSNCWGLAEGVVVDTHVLRLSNLLRLSRAHDPVKVEEDLCLKIPREDWPDFSHLLIWHGRRVCVARRPRCDECTLAELCPGRKSG